MSNMSPLLYLVIGLIGGGVLAVAVFFLAKRTSSRSAIARKQARPRKISGKN